MKLIQRQGSYENETLLSASASEEDIKLALLTIDSITTVELVVEDGSQIHSALSGEDSGYWINLTETSRRGKKKEFHTDEPVININDVIMMALIFTVTTTSSGANGEKKVNR